MTAANPFVLEADAYRRDLDVVKHYVDDAAMYLSVMTGKDYGQCAAFVKKTVRPGGALGMVDPIVRCTDRPNFEDRFEVEIPLTQYLRDAIKDADIVAPTLTTYVNPGKKQSLHVDFIDKNVKRRSRAKKEMFEAEMDQDVIKATYKKNEQTFAKIFNNALSGAYVSNSTPVYNKTAHSTLTSTCRCTSGYGNANNEKMLSGNRHYWSPDIVRNNVISIINHTDYEKFSAVMSKYDLHYPSVDDAMAVITRGSNHYWRLPKEIERIRILISKLTPLQRAAFVYTGDLYSLTLYNDGLMRGFITKLSTLVDVQHPDPNSIFKNINEDYRILAVQICESLTRGIKWSKMEKEHPDVYAIVASTMENSYKTVLEYGDLISALLTSSNVPASLGWFPTSVRYAAVTSDTDSTIFTVQDWVKWYFGKICFGSKANAVAATMIFVASQAIVHLLAMMSSNIGVEKKRLHQIAMKNEFKFDVFVTTQVAKHYYALISCREGNVYTDFKEEIKGVHLKSSNAPPAINAKAKELMIGTMKKIISGEDLYLSQILTEIADEERVILKSLRSGSLEYFRGAQIKGPDSYTLDPERSPYMHYTFWNEVFGPKHGEAPPPPYAAIKVNTSMENKTQVNAWLNSIEDQELKERMVAWLEKRNGRMLKTFYLPMNIVDSKGIPDEIFRIINVRKIVADCSKVFTLILESFGVFSSPAGKHIKLYSDYY